MVCIPVCYLHVLFVQPLYIHVHVHNWGKPERAPPRALQRLRSLSHNNDHDNDNNGGGISYILLNAHAQSLCGEFKGQWRQESRIGEMLEVSLRF